MEEISDDESRLAETVELNAKPAAEQKTEAVELQAPA